MSRRWCLTDLVTSEQTGKLSGILIWQHVAYAAITYVFLKTTLTWSLLLCYGGVVGANSVAIFWIRKHYGNSMDTGELASDSDSDSVSDTAPTGALVAKRRKGIDRGKRRAF